MRFKEITESRDSKEQYIEFNKPVAVKAVNMLNTTFAKKDLNDRAFMHDKFTVSILPADGIYGGIALDIVEDVIDSLGGGEYFDLQ